mmetsp:Transcript_22460/g.54886  ORF Transcript_22460/g.54886 Transcript_22460/m.54886 type:complete len:252 (+) Transcript_22460:1369-2124(+)
MPGELSKTKCKISTMLVSITLALRSVTRMARLRTIPLGCLKADGGTCRLLAHTSRQRSKNAPFTQSATRPGHFWRSAWALGRPRRAAFSNWERSSAKEDRGTSGKLGRSLRTAMGILIEQNRFLRPALRARQTTRRFTKPLRYSKPSEETLPTPETYSSAVCASARAIRPPSTRHGLSLRRPMGNWSEQENSSISDSCSTRPTSPAGKRGPALRKPRVTSSALATSVSQPKVSSPAPKQTSPAAPTNYRLC